MILRFLLFLFVMLISETHFKCQVQCKSVNQSYSISNIPSNSTSEMQPDSFTTTSIPPIVSNASLISSNIVDKALIKSYSKYNSKYNLVKSSRLIKIPETTTKDLTKSEWQCPNITMNQNLECGCDIPHTLRCSGNIHGLEQLADGLRNSPYSVSLLDCTLLNVTFLSDAKIFENVSLHGLVISSGEIKRVHRFAFMGMKSQLQALFLPNNVLSNVPWNSLTPLTMLDRLDLSNNRIKTLGSADFATLNHLTHLDMSQNLITTISPRAFVSLKNLLILKLNGNRLGDFPTGLQYLGVLNALEELDLKSNSIKGPFTKDLLPVLPHLDSLTLDKNLITSVQNGALQNYPHLKTLSLRHNQIDVLQDHAFKSLSLLQNLDLGYNGIIAISGASLQHLPNLVVLDMTHNFLRTLTSDIVSPLSSIKEIKLDGNDIAMIEANSLEKISGKIFLSLQDNPLSCDCHMQQFAERLRNSSVLDVLGAVCATPPKLEGAPLVHVEITEFTCTSNTNELLEDPSEQVEDISKRIDLSDIKDVSDMVMLKQIELTNDYSLLLIWLIAIKNFVCDAIFIYKEENINEILLDHIPIQCQTTSPENTIVVHLADSSALNIGDNYRFCLVLIEEIVDKNELVVGCSNITKLRASYESSIITFKKNFDRLRIPNTKIPINLVDSSTSDQKETIEFMYKSLLAVVSVMLLSFSILLLLWRISKLRKLNRSTNSSQPRDNLPISMNRSESPNSKYIKLQATTSL